MERKNKEITSSRILFLQQTKSSTNIINYKAVNQLKMLYLGDAINAYLCNSANSPHLHKIGHGNYVFSHCIKTNKSNQNISCINYIQRTVILNFGVKTQILFWLLINESYTVIISYRNCKVFVKLWWALH